MSEYSLASYGRMLADEVRMDAYAAALERFVRPGCVVLDIGTGAGTMAMMAARLGARRVYALETSEPIHFAREMARENGLGDRIEFVQEASTRWTPPERADVIVSDLRGALPLLGTHIPSIMDARARLLADNGVMIPKADTLRAAVATAEEAYREIVGPWEESTRGLDLSIARAAAANEWTRTRIEPAQLLTDAASWGRIEYRTVAEADVVGAAAWTVETAGTAHGLAVWFDAELADGIGYTSGPFGPSTVYGTAFFPWIRPIALAPGDRVETEIQARLVGDEYVWIWETRIHPVAGEVVTFRQSTFFAEPMNPARLRARAHGHRPRLTEEGRIDQAILSRMDGEASLEQIARSVAASYPLRFSRWEDALTHVGRLAERYAR